MAQLSAAVSLKPEGKISLKDISSLNILCAAYSCFIGLGEEESWGLRGAGELGELGSWGAEGAGGDVLQVVLTYPACRDQRQLAKEFAPSGLRLQNTLVRTKKQLGMAGD